MTAWPSINCRSLRIAKNLRMDITENVMKNVMYCFILNGKDLPIHYLTIADMFRDLSCDVYLWSFVVFRFYGSREVIETPMTKSSSCSYDTGGGRGRAKLFPEVDKFGKPLPTRGQGLCFAILCAGFNSA